MIGAKLVNTGIAFDAVGLVARQYDMILFIVGAILIVLGVVLLWLDR